MDVWNALYVVKSQWDNNGGSRWSELSDWVTWKTMELLDYC